MVDLTNATPAEDATLAYFHCPNVLCSAAAMQADARASNEGIFEVKLVCSLLHAYWLPIERLKRVVLYWPSEE